MLIGSTYNSLFLTENINLLVQNKHYSTKITLSNQTYHRKCYMFSQAVTDSVILK